MESLYAVCISGVMLYMIGDLSDQECVDVENIAKEMQYIKPTYGDVNHESICQKFIDNVLSSTNIKLKLIPITHVFRINSAL